MIYFWSDVPGIWSWGRERGGELIPRFTARSFAAVRKHWIGSTTAPQSRQPATDLEGLDERTADPEEASNEA